MKQMVLSFMERRFACSRRVATILAAMVLMLSLSATAALAATITCKDGGWGACIGTHSNDTITGTSGNNIIVGNGGSDTILGLAGNDYIYGDLKNNASPGNDTLSAGWGKDKLYDESSFTNDTYTGLLVNNSDGPDLIHDSGGNNDVLKLTNLSKSQVDMDPVTTDGDGKMDALYISKSGTSSSLVVYNYYDNSGASNAGVGAIETIKFSDQTVGFPAAS
jgi:Ca2+-binding RTX toxin-like protein